MRSQCSWSQSTCLLLLPLYLVEQGQLTSYVMPPSALFALLVHCDLIYLILLSTLASSQFTSHLCQGHVAGTPNTQAETCGTHRMCLFGSCRSPFPSGSSFSWGWRSWLSPMLPGGWTPTFRWGTSCSLEITSACLAWEGRTLCVDQMMRGKAASPSYSGQSKKKKKGCLL